MSTAIFTAALSVDREHPSLPGHFPGQPVVPAVVILDRVMAEIRRQLPDIEIVGVKKMKFLRRLAPGEDFQLDCAAARGGTLRFHCRCGAETLAEGNLLLAGNGAEVEGRAAPVA